VFYQPRSLRNINGDKTVSPFGVTHGLKANWIYELPIGRGRALYGDAGAVMDQIVGGLGVPRNGSHPERQPE
jgi:hypothetical protein